jgi:hypothetical protein
MGITLFDLWDARRDKANLAETLGALGVLDGALTLDDCLRMKLHELAMLVAPRIITVDVAAEAPMRGVQIVEVRDRPDEPGQSELDHLRGMLAQSASSTYYLLSGKAAQDCRADEAPDALADLQREVDEERQWAEDVVAREMTCTLPSGESRSFERLDDLEAHLLTLAASRIGVDLAITLSIHHADGRLREESLHAIEHISALEVLTRHHVFLIDDGVAIGIVSTDGGKAAVSTLAVAVHPAILASFFGTRANWWREMHRTRDVVMCVVTLALRPHEP